MSGHVRSPLLLLVLLSGSLACSTNPPGESHTKKADEKDSRVQPNEKPKSPNKIIFLANIETGADIADRELSHDRDGELLGTREATAEISKIIADDAATSKDFASQVPHGEYGRFFLNYLGDKGKGLVMYALVFSQASLRPSERITNVRLLGTVHVTYSIKKEMNPPKIESERMGVYEAILRVSKEEAKAGDDQATFEKLELQRAFAERATKTPLSDWPFNPPECQFVYRVIRIVDNQTGLSLARARWVAATIGKTRIEKDGMHERNLSLGKYSLTVIWTLRAEPDTPFVAESWLGPSDGGQPVGWSPSKVLIKRNNETGPVVWREFTCAKYEKTKAHFQSKDGVLGEIHARELPKEPGEPRRPEFVPIGEERSVASVPLIANVIVEGFDLTPVRKN